MKIIELTEEKAIQYASEMYEAFLHFVNNDNVEYLLESFNWDNVEAITKGKQEELELESYGNKLIDLEISKLHKKLEDITKSGQYTKCKYDYEKNEYTFIDLRKKIKELIDELHEAYTPTEIFDYYFKYRDTYFTIDMYKLSEYGYDCEIFGYYDLIDSSQLKYRMQFLFDKKRNKIVKIDLIAKETRPNSSVDIQRSTYSDSKLKKVLKSVNN